MMRRSITKWPYYRETGKRPGKTGNRERDGRRDRTFLAEF